MPVGMYVTGVGVRLRSVSMYDADGDTGMQQQQQQQQQQLLQQAGLGTAGGARLGSLTQQAQLQQLLQQQHVSGTSQALLQQQQMQLLLNQHKQQQRLQVQQQQGSGGKLAPQVFGTASGIAQHGVNPYGLEALKLPQQGMQQTANQNPLGTLIQMAAGFPAKLGASQTQDVLVSQMAAHAASGVDGGAGQKRERPHPDASREALGVAGGAATLVQAGRASGRRGADKSAAKMVGKRTQSAASRAVRRRVPRTRKESSSPQEPLVDMMTCCVQLKAGPSCEPSRVTEALELLAASIKREKKKTDREAAKLERQGTGAAAGEEAAQLEDADGEDGAAADRDRRELALQSPIERHKLLAWRPTADSKINLDVFKSKDQVSRVACISVRA